MLADTAAAANGTVRMMGAVVEDALSAVKVAAVAGADMPAAPFDVRDPAYIRQTLPALRMLSEIYFRADVSGLDRIPARGPVLLVGNHSGGTMIADTFVFAQAFYDHFGPELIDQPWCARVAAGDRRRRDRHTQGHLRADRSGVGARLRHTSHTGLGAVHQGDARLVQPCGGPRRHLQRAHSQHRSAHDQDPLAHHSSSRCAAACMSERTSLRPSGSSWQSRWRRSIPRARGWDYEEALEAAGLNDWGLV